MKSSLCLTVFVASMIGCRGDEALPDATESFHDDPLSINLAALPAVFDNFVFRPGGVAFDNVYTDWSDLVTAIGQVQGYKTIQFDNSIVSPCVIPAGTWDMRQIEWMGIGKVDVAIGSSAQVSLGGAPSGGDVFLPNLRKIGGDLMIINLNVGSAPVVIPAAGATFEAGLGPQGDYPQIINTGPAPFFDLTALTSTFLFRMEGAVTGNAPAFNLGSSAGSIQVTLTDSSRIAAGMVVGTNPSAQLLIFAFGTGGQVNRQVNFAGTITYGKPGVFNGVVGWPRLWLFPSSINQSPAAPSSVAFTTTTGLGMNAALRLDTTNGPVAQTLPLIRAASPPIGAVHTTPGALESTGLVVVIKNEVGGNVINVSPAAGETIEGSVETTVIPARGARTFMSDGISNWIIIAGYL